MVIPFPLISFGYSFNSCAKTLPKSPASRNYLLVPYLWPNHSVYGQQSNHEASKMEAEGDLSPQHETLKDRQSTIRKSNRSGTMAWHTHPVHIELTSREASTLLSCDKLPRLSSSNSKISWLNEGFTSAIFEAILTK